MFGGHHLAFPFISDRSGMKLFVTCLHGSEMGTRWVESGLRDKSQAHVVVGVRPVALWVPAASGELEDDISWKKGMKREQRRTKTKRSSETLFAPVLQRTRTQGGRQGDEGTCDLFFPFNIRAVGLEFLCGDLAFRT